MAKQYARRNYPPSKVADAIVKAVRERKPVVPVTPEAIGARLHVAAVAGVDAPDCPRRSEVTATAHEIKPRRVRFDWEPTPLEWIPGEPVTSHIIDVLHLLLPAGERWFVHVYKQALPLIEDEQLRADVKGFMGQEAVHSRAHAAVLDHLRANGLNPDPFTRRVDWLFNKLLGDDSMRLIPRRRWLLERVAIIAAIEHYTAVLGAWILHSPALDAAGADPTMLDLLRWHGAEEVEHRSVAFDVFRAIHNNWLSRLRTMVVSAADDGVPLAARDALPVRRRPDL